MRPFLKKKPKISEKDVILIRADLDNVLARLNELETKVYGKSRQVVE